MIPSPVELSVGEEDLQIEMNLEVGAFTMGSLRIKKCPIQGRWTGRGVIWINPILLFSWQQPCRFWDIGVFGKRDSGFGYLAPESLGSVVENCGQNEAGYR